MVIQRWQSVWLLISAICVTVFCFLPVACLSFDGSEIMQESSVSFISPSDNPVVLIVGLLAALLMVLAIFSFKDTKRQKLMTIVATLLTVVSAVSAYLMVYGAQSGGAIVEWLGSIMLLPGAVVFALLAYRGIRHDEKLLKAADRLR